MHLDDSPDSREALPLLGEVYQLRATGVFLLGPESPPLGLVIREGQIAGFCPEPGPRPVPKVSLPRPGDSSRLKLDQVLAEVGLRKRKATGPKSTKTPRAVGELRDRIAAALANGEATATFEETTEVPRDAIVTTGAIEPLILDALRGFEDKDQVRGMLGDLDKRLVATAALAKQKKTLTLTEGYLLSRVDGILSAREILQLVPLQADEAETTLAALLLTGRLKQEDVAPRPKRSDTRRLVPAENLETTAAPQPLEEADVEVEEDTPARPPKAGGVGEDSVFAADPVDDPPSAAATEPEDAKADDPPLPEPATAEETPAPSQPDAVEAEEPPPAEPIEATPEQTAEREEILELFKSLPLRNHYEILGVERRCSDADLKRAQVVLVKRFHPDMRREPYLEDLHDALEAIFIRIGEAWEALRNPTTRAAYEQYLGRVPREKEADAAKSPAEGGKSEDAGQSRGPDADELLKRAQLLLGTGRYWDAIQMLETVMPQFDSQEYQQAARILLARAYSRNPKWVHRAVETLQEVLAENPKSADAYCELGMVYKNGGLATRAEAMFRKALDASPGHKRALAELGAKADAPAASGGILRRLFGGKS